MLKLRYLEEEALDGRVGTWIQRLTEANTMKVAADELYCGDHWSVVRSIVANWPSVDVWICSAGYGLVRAEERIAAYSATFSTGHPDSVHREGGSPRETHGRWWSHLAAWSGPTEGRPRTLADLAKQQPSRPVLVVASATYLQAMRQDLVRAIGELRDTTLLSILSAGTGRLEGLGDHLLPYDARLRRVLGGGMMSLNVRVAREVLRQSWPLRAPDLAHKLTAMVEDLAPVVSPVRTPQHDEAVRAFVIEELERDPSQGYSPLLRKLRDERNWACEQKRFRVIYDQVRTSEPTFVRS